MTKAVNVVFLEHGYWSRAYTYIADNFDLKPGDVVVVPTNKFYSVGKVTKTTDNFTPKENINYKEVFCKLDV